MSPNLIVWMLNPQTLSWPASLWIGSGEGLAIKGFGDLGSRLSSGGSFPSSGRGRSRSSLGIALILLFHFNLPGSAVWGLLARVLMSAFLQPPGKPSRSQLSFAEALGMLNNIWDQKCLKMSISNYGFPQKKPGPVGNRLVSPLNKRCGSFSFCLKGCFDFS